jgi:hypothetical protein
MRLKKYTLASILILSSSLALAGGGGIECSKGQDRFKDNANGTVTDNCTQLIWLKNADCFGRKNWQIAKSKANQLAAGRCGLTDGSSAGNWRLPKVKELQSLIDFSHANPALPKGHPFTDVQTYVYWSSTEYVSDTNVAWRVDLYDGDVNTDDKSGTNYVWPVHSQQ